MKALQSKKGVCNLNREQRCVPPRYRFPLRESKSKGSLTSVPSNENEGFSEIPNEDTISPCDRAVWKSVSTGSEPSSPWSVTEIEGTSESKEVLTHDNNGLREDDGDDRLLAPFYQHPNLNDNQGPLTFSKRVLFLRTDLFAAACTHSTQSLRECLNETRLASQTLIWRCAWAGETTWVTDQTGSRIARSLERGCVDTVATMSVELISTVKTVGVAFLN